MSDPADPSDPSDPPHKPPGRFRGLSREDLELWHHVARRVERPRRLAGRAQAHAPEPHSGPHRHEPGVFNPGSVEKTPALAPAESHRSPAAQPAKKGVHQPFDPRLKKKIARGQHDIAARLDLHGMTESVAHAELYGFLASAQRQGLALVLVITGKGNRSRDAEETWRPESGILRQRVPHWLREPKFRSLVISFDWAHLRHGGSGAIYVRVRRLR